MSQLIAMFCDIDDFCKWFEPLYMQRLLQDGQRHRARQGHLVLSEIMTIIVYFTVAITAISNITTPSMWRGTCARTFRRWSATATLSS